VDMDQKHCLVRCKYEDLRFADLGHQGNFRISNLPINHCKYFADFRFADWHTSEICEFALRHEPKNLRICVATFA
jgi:hypothetical protein